MTALLPLVILGPMVVAGALVGLRVSRRTRQAVLFAVLVGSLAAAAWLVAATSGGAVLVTRLGGWPAPIGVPFAVDAFSALMLVLTVLLTTVVCAFALRSRAADEPYFCPLVLVVTAGVNGALMTADLFNLFVFIEIMLLPSYGLIILAHRGRGKRMQVSASRIYVTVNLLTSALFLAGVAAIYATLGAVDLAGLAGRAERSPWTLLACGIVLFALSVKAAVVPVHGWLGRTYPHLSPTVSALFASLHTKVAVYAIFRLYAVLFDERRLGWLITTVFCISMVVGVLGAVGEDNARAILSFHMVSQIGYVLLGVGIFTGASLSAGIFYLIHNVIAKASLFLSTGAVELRYGRHRLGEVRGLLWRETVTGLTFLAAAVSLAGLPPFSGFVAKLAIISAAFADQQWAAGAVALGVSLFTLLSMLKIWGAAFLGEPDPPLAADEGPRIGIRTIAPAAFLAVLSLALGVTGQPVLALCETAAAGLLHPAAYLAALSGGGV
ncbi:MAG: monovalent cation/H+ antiporter subunit D family protein [Tetrasphaera sp.]